MKRSRNERWTLLLLLLLLLLGCPCVVPVDPAFCLAALNFAP
jgi:hypothetical protein